MKAEQMMARRTHGNEARHSHVIEGWPLLEQLILQGPSVHERFDLSGTSVNVTLVCPSLRDLTITGMDDLETCEVVSLVLSKLGVQFCPCLDVSSMILPSLEFVDVSYCNVSSISMTFDFDMCRSCIFV